MRTFPLLVIATLVLVAPSLLSARDVLKVSDGYILEAPPTARSNVGYAVISNSARRPVTLLAIDSDRFTRLEMHSMTDNAGVMQMRNERTVAVPARGELRFEPGKLHFMLFGAEPRLRAGEKVELLLQSASGDSVKAVFEVRAQPGMQEGADAEPAVAAPPATGTLTPDVDAAAGATPMSPESVDN